MNDQLLEKNVKATILYLVATHPIAEALLPYQIFVSVMPAVADRILATVFDLIQIEIENRNRAEQQESDHLIETMRTCAQDSPKSIPQVFNPLWPPPDQHKSKKSKDLPPTKNNPLSFGPSEGLNKSDTSFEDLMKSQHKSLCLLPPLKQTTPRYQAHLKQKSRNPNDCNC